MQCWPQQSDFICNPFYIFNIWFAHKIVGSHNHHNILVSSGGFTSNFLHLPGKVPKAEGAIPSSRQSKLSIWRDDNVTNEVRVPSEGALGDAIVGFIPGQLPHDDRLVWEGKKCV